MHNEVLYNSQPKPFWNIVSIIISTFAIGITLFNNGFFNAFKKAFTGANYNTLNFVVNCLTIGIFIVIIINAIIYGKREKDRKFYNELELFLDEIKK